MRLTVFCLVTAALVPVLLMLPWPSARPAAAIASLATIVTLGLNHALRFRDQWENYRYTEQYLDREKFLFLASAGAYRAVDPQDAFVLFVERVEWAIAAENSTTLATMSLSPGPALTKGE